MGDRFSILYAAPALVYSIIRVRLTWVAVVTIALVWPLEAAISHITASKSRPGHP